MKGSIKFPRGLFLLKKCAVNSTITRAKPESDMTRPQSTGSCTDCNWQQLTHSKTNNRIWPECSLDALKINEQSGSVAQKSLQIYYVFQNVD